VTPLVVTIRRHRKTRSRMGECSRGARGYCAPIHACGHESGVCQRRSDKLGAGSGRRPFRHSHRPSVSGSRASLFSLRRWSSNSVAHRRSIRFLPCGSVATLSLGRAIFGCCPLNSRVLDHILQDQIETPENHQSEPFIRVAAHERQHAEKGQGNVPYSSGVLPKVAGAFHHVFVRR